MVWLGLDRGKPFPTTSSVPYIASARPRLMITTARGLSCGSKFRPATIGMSSSGKNVGSTRMVVTLRPGASL
jgi:hypothetical protein